MGDNLTGSTVKNSENEDTAFAESDSVEPPLAKRQIQSLSTPNLNKRFKSNRFKRAFVSPMRKDEICITSKENPTDTKFLEEKEKELDTEIEKLEKEGIMEEELQTHIDKLHEYNEIKDIGQMVLGRLATSHGVTTKHLYEKYGLNLED